MFETCFRIDLGLRDFEEVWSFQRRLVKERQADRLPDLLLFVEHPKTYTIGRGGKREHLLVTEGELRELGASFVETDRGGDITFHGPGQIVGYPILDLSRWRKDVHLYLRALEEVLIQSLAELGVEGHREEGLTGVWHPSGKLAAIGVRVSRWVTSHGFALNVSSQQDDFKRIIPCGIVGRGVSAVKEVLEVPVALSDVRDIIARAFGRVFSRQMVTYDEAELEARVS
jgi:lipoyl(octanoyl) transferase